MNGDLAFVVVVLLLAVALALVAWLAKQNVDLAKSSAESSRAALALVEKQQILLSSADAMTYQAIRAMDYVGGYAEPSALTDVEEPSGGNGSDDGVFVEDAGFGGDPFVAGTLFGTKL